MNWKKKALGAFVVTALMVGCGDTGGMDNDVLGDGATRTYILSAADVPPVDETAGTAVGFNIDGTVSTGDGESCADAADFNSSIDGSAGVDNQFSAVLLPALGKLADIDDVGALVAEQIAEGSFLLIVEVRDVDEDGDEDNDSLIEVELLLGELPEGVTVPVLDGSGRLEANQPFVRGMTLATISTASIDDGRLILTAPELPLSFAVDGNNITLNLTEARMEADITATTLTNGVIGAQVTVADIIAIGEVIMPGVVTPALVQSFAQPDLLPNPDGSECGAVSAGLTFSALEADLPEGS